MSRTIKLDNGLTAGALKDRLYSVNLHDDPIGSGSSPYPQGAPRPHGKGIGYSISSTESSTLPVELSFVVITEQNFCRWQIAKSLQMIQLTHPAILVRIAPA
jgi:hypothetical protein